MKKEIEYYLGLPYTRELIPEEDGKWFVRIKELPNCFSQGESPEEALAMIEDALQGWLEVELEEGSPIPEPKPEEEYSGKFNTRVPKSMHRKMVEQADREGVSLNQWILSVLAEALGGSQEKTRSSGGAFADFTQSVCKLLEYEEILPEEPEKIEQAFSIWMNKKLEYIRIHENDTLRVQENLGGLKSMLENPGKKSVMIKTIYSIFEVFSRVLNVRQPAVPEGYYPRSKPAPQPVEMKPERISTDLDIENLFRPREQQKKEGNE